MQSPVHTGASLLEVRYRRRETSGRRTHGPAMRPTGTACGSPVRSVITVGSCRSAADACPFTIRAGMRARTEQPVTGSRDRHELSTARRRRAGAVKPVYMYSGRAMLGLTFTRGRRLAPRHLSYE